MKQSTIRIYTQEEEFSHNFPDSIHIQFPLLCDLWYGKPFNINDYTEEELSVLVSDILTYIDMENNTPVVLIETAQSMFIAGCHIRKELCDICDIISDKLDEINAQRQYQSLLACVDEFGDRPVKSILI